MPPTEHRGVPLKNDELWEGGSAVMGANVDSGISDLKVVVGPFLSSRSVSVGLGSSVLLPDGLDLPLPSVAVAVGLGSGGRSEPAAAGSGSGAGSGSYSGGGLASVGSGGGLESSALGSGSGRGSESAASMAASS